jgi:transcriptional regulator with XRE-family HTH domain
MPDREDRPVQCHGLSLGASDDNESVIIGAMKRTAAARILRLARRRAGLTQRALAAKAGVPQPAIARIELGGVSPRLNTLTALLAATGVTLEPVPLAGAGVDRSLIRASLARSPEERIRAAGRAADNLAAFRHEVARGSAR